MADITHNVVTSATDDTTITDNEITVSEIKAAGKRSGSGKLTYVRHYEPYCKVNPSYFVGGIFIACSVLGVLGVLCVSAVRVLLVWSVICVYKY